MVRLTDNDAEKGVRPLVEMDASLIPANLAQNNNNNNETPNGAVKP